MFLFQQQTNAVSPGDVFKAARESFLAQVQILTTAVSKIKVTGDNKQFLSDYNAALKRVTDNLGKIDLSKISEPNKQDYYKLLDGYGLLLTTYKIGYMYLSDEFVPPRNRENFETSLREVRKTLAPTMVSSLENVLGGKKVELNQEDVQKVVSNFVIISKTYERAKKIMDADRTAEALKNMGVTEQEPTGKYFFERPSKKFFGETWTNGAFYVDYAIMYGAGKVSELKETREARKTIQDFFNDTKLSISGRYDYYLALVDMFSKVGPVQAYKLISENKKDTPQATLDAAIDAYNTKYSVKFGKIEKPVIVQAPPAPKGVYKTIEEFKKDNAESLKKLFGEAVTDSKFDPFITANFKEGETFSKAKLGAIVDRTNNAANHYYGAIIEQLAGVPTSGKWTLGNKSVLDIGNAGKVDLYELLAVYSDAELKAAAESLLKAKVDANVIPQDKQDKVALLNKIDPKLDTKEQEEARVNALVKAELFIGINEETYGKLDKTQQKLVFEWNDKYYQLTDNGKNAIKGIDKRYNNEDALAISVKQVEKGLDEQLVSKKGVPDEDYQWLGNLLLLAKNQAMGTGDIPYWSMGSNALETAGQATKYAEGLSSLSGLKLGQPEFKPSSVLELALYNASQTAPDLALQNALLYKNGNTQTPRTSQELQALLGKLVSDKVALNFAALLGAIGKIDGQQEIPQNVQQMQTDLTSAWISWAKSSVNFRDYLKPGTTDFKDEYLSSGKLDPSKFPEKDQKKIKAYVSFNVELTRISSKYLDPNSGNPLPNAKFDQNDKIDLEAAVKAFNLAMPTEDRTSQDLQGMKNDLGKAWKLVSDNLNIVKKYLKTPGTLSFDEKYLTQDKYQVVYESFPEEERAKIKAFVEFYIKVNSIDTKYLDPNSGNLLPNAKFDPNDKTALKEAVSAFNESIKPSSGNTQKTNVESAKALLDEGTNKQALFKNLKESDELKSVDAAKLPTLVEDFLKDNNVIEKLNNFTGEITIDILVGAISSWYAGLEPTDKMKYASNVVPDADQ